MSADFRLSKPCPSHRVPAASAGAHAAPRRRQFTSLVLMAGLMVSPVLGIAPAIGAAGAQAAGPCAVTSLTKSAIQGLKVYSYDGTKYLLNHEDANGIAQVYVAAAGSTALTCITCTQRPGGPAADRFKMQPHWHPSGKWIFMAVERATYTVPPIFAGNRDYIEGQLQNGMWTNMYVASPDGQTWQRLTDFTGAPGTADGYSGVAVTGDGTKVVWSQIVDGNIFSFWPFGRWELTQADFGEQAGVPMLANLKNITPPGMNWNEPGNFARDNESLVITGSVELDAQGMDQYVLNIRTKVLVNLTSSPTVWDEHGRFSPGGDKIVFMSAYPYRDDPNTSQALTIKTEFMMMNRDGTGLTQLTHFLEPGYPEFEWFGSGIAANPEWQPDGRALSLRRLRFPNYEDWDLHFAGVCGNKPGAPTGVRIVVRNDHLM